MRSTAV